MSRLNFKSVHGSIALACLIAAIDRPLRAGPPNNAAPPNDNDAVAAPQEVNAAFGPGWPIALPGEVTGPPAVFDLDGDGRPDIVVPCMQRAGVDPVEQPVPGRRAPQFVHPHPSMAAQLFAFHADGKPLANFPVTLVSAAERKHQVAERRWHAELWYASPGLIPNAFGDGKNAIVMPTPDPRATLIVSAAGAITDLGGRTDPWGSPPVVDLDGDGRPDLLAANSARTTDGDPPRNWVAGTLSSGYSPCVGDALGDKRLEFFHPFYERYSDRPGQPDAHALGGFDAAGQPLPGWPQPVDNIVLYPVMGDVTGDGRKEIVAVDEGGNLHVWSPDGTPASKSPLKDAAFPDVVATGFDMSGGVALADLDRDGKAEIVGVGQKNQLRILRGDGRPLNAEPQGVIADLPPGARSCGEPAVVGPDADGQYDIFAGSIWIRLAADLKTSKITPMSAATAVTACTVADLFGDGKITAVFGTADGRVIVYRTDLALNPAHAQWPTHAGEPQHTGCWTNPSTPPAVITTK